MGNTLGTAEFFVAQNKHYKHFVMTSLRPYCKNETSLGCAKDDTQKTPCWRLVETVFTLKDQKVIRIPDE